jgi:general secretion pathway protein H
MPPTSRGSQRGFTLLEMIVVIVIMGLIAGLVLVRQPWHSAGLDLDATQRALIATLRLARSRAIVQDRTVAVVADARGFSLDNGAMWVLPADEALTPAQMIFTPDGGSSGGTILLASTRRRIAVNVNWLTGRVRAQELPAQ